MRLAWKNLKENRCPQCGNQFNRSEHDDYRCDKCGFFCRESRAQEIVGDLNVVFCSNVPENIKYAYVVLTPEMGKDNAKRRKMSPGTKGYSLIYLKNADDLASLTGNRSNCTVFDKSLLKKVTRDEVEKYLNSLTPVNVVGGAKHTRRSHATGPRKNVTRHGNRCLMRRRTHKGRKRGAHKTAKK